MRPPADLAAAIEEAWERVRAAPGFLTEREGRFLALAAACAPAAGAILEIGSFKGKSTVGLASVAAHYGLDPVVTVDPHTAPSVTDPDLGGQPSSWEDFSATIRKAGLTTHVEAHRSFSMDVARDWKRPIRFLWIDGDHTYHGSKTDFDLFHRHLVDGAIIAFHDVLHTFDGPVRVFVEDVLRSDRFGPAGLVGSIGWAQYRPAAGVQFRPTRRRLERKVARLLPLVQHGPELYGWRKMRYKVWRALIPHAAVDPARWAAAVTLTPDT